LGCHQAPADPVILALGDQIVRRSDFDRHVREVERRDDAPVDPAVREALLEPFLEQRLLVLEARARGLVGPGGTPEEEAAAVRHLLEQAVPPPEVAEEEVARYFEEHRAELSQPETVTLRQILVPTENEARDVRRRLAREPRSFEKLARTRSRSPEASAGGLMGRFARGELPAELEAAAFALPVGGTSDVVATPLGYHVLRVVAREPAREATLEGSREKVREVLERQKSDRGVRQFLRGLMRRAKVNHEAAKAAPRPS
jgi:peptidyl-prolyl cis-trans isomerase C